MRHLLSFRFFSTFTPAIENILMGICNKKDALVNKRLITITNLYTILKRDREAAKEIQQISQSESDSEMKSIFEEELNSSIVALNTTEELLLNGIRSFSHSDNSPEEVILEIRAGTGGTEATYFASEMHQLYKRYSLLKSWSFKEMETSKDCSKSLREGIFLIKGKGAYERFVYESGVHRVQRIPESESAGRVHTSTVTVAVLKKSDSNFHVKQSDLDIEAYRAGVGPGGQHLNTTASAVRVTHIPTGLIVTCMKERCQVMNREFALQIMHAKLAKTHNDKLQLESCNSRKQQVKSAERCEKIRTYNFPQNRITDHRIPINLYNINVFFTGSMLDDLYEEFFLQDGLEKLKNLP